MAREENLMMQERKDDYCKSQGFKEAKKKKKRMNEIWSTGGKRRLTGR